MCLSISVCVCVCISTILATRLLQPIAFICSTIHAYMRFTLFGYFCRLRTINGFHMKSDFLLHSNLIEALGIFDYFFW